MAILIEMKITNQRKFCCRKRTLAFQEKLLASENSILLNILFIIVSLIFVKSMMVEILITNTRNNRNFVSVTSKWISSGFCIYILSLLLGLIFMLSYIVSLGCYFIYIFCNIEKLYIICNDVDISHFKYKSENWKKYKKVY